MTLSLLDSVIKVIRARKTVKLSLDLMMQNCDGLYFLSSVYLTTLSGRNATLVIPSFIAAST